MKNILSTYLINDQTLALTPARHIDYYTVVHEVNQTLYVKQTPFEIIKANCLEHLSSYQGIREAIIHRFGYKRKVPIIINHEQGFVTFPTHSPEHIDCAWIFFKHVRKIELLTRATSNSPSNKSIITFSNRLELEIPVSTGVLEKQMMRTSIVLIKC